MFFLLCKQFVEQDMEVLTPEMRYLRIRLDIAKQTVFWWLYKLVIHIFSLIFQHFTQFPLDDFTLPMLNDSLQ